MEMRRLGAELFGTAVLVAFAVGSAVFGAALVGPVGIALAFGLLLPGLFVLVGPVSGCHLNPAVTVGMLVRRRIAPTDAAGYVVAQLFGAVLGSALIWAVSRGISGFVAGSFGSNGYGDRSAVGVNAWGAFLAEVVMTFLLVLVWLVVTGRGARPVTAGVTVGLALTVVTLFGIPLTGASVNPARSLGPALFAGTAALSQLWLFLVAPLVGGVLAGLAQPLLEPPTAVGPGGILATVPEPRAGSGQREAAERSAPS